MREGFIFITVVMELFLGFLGYVYPFVSALRGRNIGKLILKVWAALVVGSIFLCLVFPEIAYSINPVVGREVLNKWVPEGPAVVALLFLGWMPPLLAAAVGKCVRGLLQAYWPKAAAYLDSTSCNSNETPDEKKG